VQAIIFFDGVCNLCNRFVNFIIRHDKKKYFLFASLQSAEATALLASHGYISEKNLSVVLLESGKLYFRSAASLRIAKRLDGLVKLLYAFIFLPTVIRDSIYDFIASKRYGWFGRRESCMVPGEDVYDRFLPQAFQSKPD
jgi:predicted DCC family thiol-disulfide oxidoreductase YuxK